MGVRVFTPDEFEEEVYDYPSLAWVIAGQARLYHNAERAIAIPARRKIRYGVVEFAQARPGLACGFLQCRWQYDRKRTITKAISTSRKLGFK
jgi:hypothetical protein